jgi:hypothetical protein
LDVRFSILISDLYLYLTYYNSNFEYKKKKIAVVFRAYLPNLEEIKKSLNKSGTSEALFLSAKVYKRYTIIDKKQWL